MKKGIPLLFILLLKIYTVNSQDLKEFENIIKKLKENAIGEVSTKCIDLDNDGDNDFLFEYVCGEPKCFNVYMNVNGKLESLIFETGSISYEYENSSGLSPSHLILKSRFGHCCGESPFDSYRKFIFKNDSYEIIENYVKYDHVDYCEDEDPYSYVTRPDDFLSDTYKVRITRDRNNVRFSADLNKHNATFVCIENSNIISHLKENAIVEVLAEYKGNDYEKRTWLYVDIDKSNLYSDNCDSPLSYEYEKQKLRAWISNKNTILQP